MRCPNCDRETRFYLSRKYIGTEIIDLTPSQDESMLMAYEVNEDRYDEVLNQDLYCDSCHTVVGYMDKSEGEGEIHLNNGVTVDMEWAI